MIIKKIYNIAIFQIILLAQFCPALEKQSEYRWNVGFLEKNYYSENVSDAVDQLTKGWLSMQLTLLDSGYMRMYGVGNENGEFQFGKKGGIIQIKISWKGQKGTIVGIKVGDGTKNESLYLHKQLQTILKKLPPDKEDTQKPNTSTQIATQTRGPLKYEEILELLKSHVPTKRLVDIVSQYGLDFDPIQHQIDELKQNGADTQLLEILEAHKKKVVNSSSTNVQTMMDSICDRVYRIQPYVTSNIDRAGEEKKNIESIFSYSTYIISSPPFFKVQIGDFYNRDSAEEVLKKIKSIGYKDSWIVIIQPDSIVSENKHCNKSSFKGDPSEYLNTEKTAKRLFYTGEYDSVVIILREYMKSHGKDRECEYLAPILIRSCLKTNLIDYARKLFMIYEMKFPESIETPNLKIEIDLIE